MEEKSLQRSVLFPIEDFPTQRRRHQLSAIRSDELRGLGQDANEMQRQEVGLVDDLVKTEQ